jgi:hypothetical protein
MIWVQEQAISEKTELANVYLKNLNQTLFSPWWSGEGLGM